MSKRNQIAMQHQYWVTKKSVLRKLGGKEDECIVSSDAELDAKLELFKSINDSCSQLQRVIDLYQERLCYLAQEENSLGRYLKECGKNEKNLCAGQIMSAAGKALAYIGHQRLTVRPPLVRLHHEVETFRSRAVTDTRTTVSEMERARTEYRAALSWMKSASSQLDPDTGHGLERFRKAQSYVKSTKIRFDHFTLSCLQKVDLLAAARCNMFSHVLVPYENAIENFSTKASETLNSSVEKLDSVQPFEYNVVSELFTPLETDKDKNTFFNAEYSDNAPFKEKELIHLQDNGDNMSPPTSDANFFDEDIAASPMREESSLEQNNFQSNSALLGLNWASNSSDFFKGDFMPSNLLQDGSFNLSEPPLNKEDAANMEKSDKKTNKFSKSNENHVSWLSLFAELDPLANPPNAKIDDNSV